MRPKRLDSLTSLRFFAAAFVVVHHTVGPDRRPGFDLGYLGVTFFFVLSGFVLTWSESAGRGALVFYRNRFARIYPLNLVTLLLATVLPLAIANTPVTFVQSLTLMQAWSWDGAHAFNWVSWSISAEMLFYLLFPIAILVLRRASNTSIVIVAVTSWLVQPLATLLILRHAGGAGAFLTYDFPPFRFPEFMVGICLALFARRVAQVPKTASVAVVILALEGALAALWTDASGRLPIRSYMSFDVLPLVVVLIWVAVQRERAGAARFLTNRWLRRLGDWSFALYMVHALILRVLAALVGKDAVGYFPAWAGLPVLVLCVAVGAVASEFIEKPAERLLRSRERPQQPAGEDVRPPVAPDSMTAP